MTTRARATAGPSLYREPWRPQFHYSQPARFMNDPNGLVHHDGEYHLFYQWRPGDGIVWGHAVSRDLLRWRTLPVAIPRQPDGKDVFSGSIVVDRADTSGLGTAGRPAMVAVYTADGPGTQTQNLAYSLDNGRTFTFYAGNPVLDRQTSQFRDPKVFWHAPTSRWVMTVALSDRRQIAVYASHDLKDWALQSTVGPFGLLSGEYECPDLFALDVDGDPRRAKWVMLVSTNPGGLWGGSMTAAFVGDFDGTAFVPDDDGAWLDWGKDYYAATTYTDAPDGRRLCVGWIDNWAYAELDAVPTTQWWRGQQSEPRELALRTVDGRPRLVQCPLRELESLRAGAGCRERARAVRGEHTLPVRGSTLDVRATLRPGTATRFGLKVLAGANGDETIIGYDGDTSSLYLDRTRSGAAGSAVPGFPGVHTVGLALHRDRLDLRILVDNSIVEVFANDGERVLTDLVYPGQAGDGVRIFAEGGTARLDCLQVDFMRSIWQQS